jgi:hypothetical protein
MSNQRRGNWKKASMADDNQDMKLYAFFKSCQEVLERNGEEDAAYYFEQIVDHMQAGRSLYQDKPERIFGM